MPPSLSRGDHLDQMRSGKDGICSKSDHNELVCRGRGVWGGRESGPVSFRDVDMVQTPAPSRLSEQLLTDCFRHPLQIFSHYFFGEATVSPELKPLSRPLCFRGQQTSIMKETLRFPAPNKRIHS